MSTNMATLVWTLNMGRSFELQWLFAVSCIAELILNGD